MPGRAPLRVLIGISIFWLPLSLLFDGLTVLVLPAHLLGITDGAQTATRQGLITFVGLLAAMLIQPMAGLLVWGLRRLTRRKA